MPQALTDDKSTLVQAMAWCRQVPSHYLNQCWPRSPTPYGVTRPHWVKMFHVLSSVLYAIITQNGISVRWPHENRECNSLWRKLPFIATQRRLGLGLNIKHIKCWNWNTQGLHSLSGRMSYRQISWSPEVARFDVIMIVSLWNLTSIPAQMLSMCLSNFRATVKV